MKHIGIGFITGVIFGGIMALLFLDAPTFGVIVGGIVGIAIGYLKARVEI